MTIVTNTVNYLDGETLLEGFFAFDDEIKTPRPAVLISHAWCGRGEFVAEKAKALAKLGFVGFALDMYGAGKFGKNDAECAELMSPFIKDRAKLQQRVKAALMAVKLLTWVDDKKIAAIGFCFGGLCVLDLARTNSDVKGVVSFHGLLHAPNNLENSNINTKILVLHGHNDPLVPIEQVYDFQNEMTAREADWQLHTYGNTVHAFTNPQATDFAAGYKFDENANHRSWQAMENFLTDIFA